MNNTEILIKLVSQLKHEGKLTETLQNAGIDPISWSQFVQNNKF